MLLFVSQGGRTALMLAASKGDFHLVDEILNMISEKNVNAVDYVRLSTFVLFSCPNALCNRMDSQL